MQRAVDCADWSRWRGFKVSYRAVIPDAVIPAAVIPVAVIPVMVIPVMVIVAPGNPLTGEQ